MKYLSAVLGLLCAALWSAEAAAQDGMISAKARRWRAEISGDLKVDDNGVGGSDLNVSSTLGLNDKEDFDEFHATLGLPLLGKFNFQYLTGTYTGTRTLTSDITYAGTTYSATSNNQIHTDVDIKSYTLLWQFGASTPGIIGASVGAGGLAGLKYFDIVTAVDDDQGNHESVDIRAPVPVVGAYVRTALASFLFVEAQVHGLKIPGNLAQGLSGNFYDATIALDAKISTFYAGIGYRLFHFEVKYESGSDVNANVDLKGIFFEVGLSF
ncbi:MAG TPA: hypothetical protein VK661_01095 [Planctomycetota bacterium]|nr:hypothetical protein [Planctomycetota bacterium]